MSKKYSFAPVVVLTAPGGDGSETGAGSGEGGEIIHAEPMSYTDWLKSDWADDYIENGVIDEYDYAVWWEFCEFTQDSWESLNPSLPWDDYFG